MREKSAMIAGTALRAILIASVASGAILTAVTARAENPDCFLNSNCLEDASAKTDYNSSARKAKIANNSETAVDPKGALEDGAGFSLSVDGEVIAGSQTLADAQRKADVALSEADIQVKFDGLDVKPILNVATVPARDKYKPGETLSFRVGLNYGLWIERGEIIIAEIDGIRAGEAARVAVDASGTASWQVPKTMNSRLTYVLRVYDREGRYDETKPQMLSPVDAVHDPSADGPLAENQVQQALTEDRTALRNIPVYGGGVTVFGRGVSSNANVSALGEQVQVDPEGNFVIQRILPPGDHAVDVSVRDSDNSNLDFSRDINIPKNEWFYVGLADFTLGRRFGNADMKAVYPGEYDKFYNKGRLAFYLKGKIKGSTLLTAALDTGEHDVRNILKRIDEKDPRRFLKRIDPDDYYPVYGDDSTSVEDAPTSGHFYVRLQRDDSHVMWGNYKAYINGNKFLTNQRALYGAQGVYKSQTVKLDGSRSTEISVHAAQPGTLTQNDTLRGTGGSSYFLKHQDITPGSETVSIEHRDPVTGFVVSRTTLKDGDQYDIDHSQGMLLLGAPLPSTIAGQHVYVVVAYEYTPATTDVKGYAGGARAQQWFGDHVRVGATVMRDHSGDASLNLGGADVRLQATEKSYLDLHAAQSRGGGFGYSASVDGGLNYNDISPLTGTRRRAKAFGAEARIDLGEMSGGAVKGDLQADYARRAAGFSTLDSQYADRKEDIRLASRVEVTDHTAVGVEANQSQSPGKTDRELKGIISQKVTEQTTVDVYVKDTQKSGATAPVAENGHRIDVGSRVTHAIDEDTRVYVFGQATAKRNKTRRRDDRAGVGAKTDLNDKFALEGEVSGGTQGVGALGKIVFTPAEGAQYYLGYELDPYRDLDTSLSAPLSGNDLGRVIMGGRQKVSEEVSFYIEDSYDMFGLKRTLAQVYGVEYNPHEHWALASAVEFGNVFDNTITDADIKRRAVSGSIAYRHPDGNSAKLKAEARHDDDKVKGDLVSYLLDTTIDWRANENWRVLANLDAVLTDASDTTRDGDYVEGSIGYAYRPVEHDRLNALVKYTYLYDLPGTDQVTTDGTTSGALQRSHIFSADAIYDLTDTISIGAKYGVRIGEIKDRAPGSTWEKSIAHLGIIRGDIDIAKDWEFLLEGRAFWTPTSDSTRFGTLAAIYRHMGENFKLGIGYNFGRFSDDLADLTADDHGVFINAVGKF